MATPTFVMEPATGERLLRFVGDRVRFSVRGADVASARRALLRTNLGRAAACRREIIAAHAGGAVHAGASWRDVPMQKAGDGWEIELPLAEVGFFKAKACLLDDKNWQHWPEGPDAGIGQFGEGTDVARRHIDSGKAFGQTNPNGAIGCVGDGLDAFLG